MDFLLIIGSISLIIIGFVARFREDWLWQLYQLEPRWRRDNPEQPKDWDKRARRHGTFYISFGVIFFMMAIIITQI